MHTAENANDLTLRAVRLRAFAILAAFFVAVTAKVLVVQLLVLGGGDVTGMLLNAVFAFVVLATVDLFFADMRLRALLIADASLTVLLLMVVLYHSYYGVLPTRSSLMLLGQATTVGSSVGSLINPLFLLLFADIALFAGWAARYQRRGLDPVTGRRPGTLIVPGLRTPYVYQRRLVYVASVAAAVVFGLSVQSARAGSELTDSRAVARARGVMAYATAAALGTTAATQPTMAAPQLQARIDELIGGANTGSVPGFVAGSAAGKHVIVVQVEALQTAAIGAEVGGVPVTPNLNELASRSWYFPNHVSAVGLGTTSDAEFVANTSLYTPQDAAASLAYADRQITSLPRILGERGYESYTFHTNAVEYWNRSQLYPALGFSEHFDKAYFGTADTIAFGASDAVLFDKTLSKLEEADRRGVPFYAQVITMSSHFPFTQVPSDRRMLPLAEPYVGTIEGDYLTEIHYADAELGRFIDRLEASGLLEECVLVVYGDHFGLPEPRNDAEAGALKRLLGHAYTPVDKLLTPLFVRLPGQSEGRTFETVVGTVDLLPTLADAIGVDLAETPHFGRSVFATGDRLISAGGLLPAGAYVDNSVLYIPGDGFADGRAYDVNTRTEVSVTAASEAKYDAVRELLRLSAQHVSALPVRADYDADAKRTLPMAE